MKILYVIDQPNLFGSELHLLDIVQYQRNEHTIKVVCFRNGDLVKLLNELGVETYIINWRSWSFNKNAYKKFISILKKFAPDIVHAHQPKATVYSSIICHLKRIRNISTIHAIPIQSASNYYGIKKILVYLFHLFVIYLTNIFADKSIYVSQETEKKFSLIKSKSFVIHNWVSPRLKSINLKDKKLSNNRFLCISSLVESKGIKELILLFYKIKSLNPNSVLTIAGDSNNTIYKKELTSLVNKLGLTDSVIFKGYCPDVSTLYQKNDIFISLTKGETFGLVFIEAMYYGCPIICTNLDILKEIIPLNNLFIDTNTNTTQLVNFLEITNLQTISNNNYYYTRNQYDYVTQQKKLSNLYFQILSTIN